MPQAENERRKQASNAAGKAKRLVEFFVVMRIIPDRWKEASTCGAIYRLATLLASRQHGRSYDASIRAWPLTEGSRENGRGGSGLAVNLLELPKASVLGISCEVPTSLLITNVTRHDFV